jgi:hypothetical protein
LGKKKMESRRFIVLADVRSPEQEQAVTGALKKLGTWWHWIPNSWLVVTEEGTSAKDIRDELGKLQGIGVRIVLDYDNNTWAAGGSTVAGPQDVFEWIKKSWKKPPELSSLMKAMSQYQKPPE